MLIRETQLTRQWSLNMINVMRCGFQQCLATFTMLFLEGSSETGLFRHFCNYVFVVCKFRNTKAVRVIFFWKYLKFMLDLKNAPKKWEKVFSFWDNCIRIGIVQFSLSRAGYFSPVAKVWTSSRKICHVNKRDFFEYNFVASHQWIW